MLRRSKIKGSQNLRGPKFKGSKVMEFPISRIASLPYRVHPVPIRKELTPLSLANPLFYTEL